MFEKLPRKTLTATLAALTAALGVGGIAVAQNNGSAPKTPTTKVDTPEPGDTPDAAEAPDVETDDDGPGHVDQADHGDGDGETADDGPAAAPAT